MLESGEIGVRARDLVRADSRALIILAEFSAPSSVAAAAQRLESQADTALRSAGILSAMYDLIDAGALVPAGNPSVEPAARSAQLRMLADETRTTAFLKAILSVVATGDVVVDLGTGSGVLAVAAAKAGAQRVYAIEQGSIAAIAERVFESNGVADRVELVRGRSLDIVLPERADVLVSEIVGDDPLSERLLESIVDARSRFLRDGGRLIPRGLRIVGLPVEMDETLRLRKGVFCEAVARWRTLYGIDFSPLMDEALRPVEVMPQHQSGWRPSAPSIELADIDLSEIVSTSLDVSSELTLTAPAVIDGLLVAFELDLAPGVVLSTLPGSAADSNHWPTLIWPRSQRLRLASGQRVCASYTYRAGAPGALGRIEPI